MLSASVRPPPWTSSTAPCSRTTGSAHGALKKGIAMCGIVGYFDRTDADARVGARLLAMLSVLAGRGPDSSGIALWGPGSEGLIARVKTGTAADVLERVRRLGPIVRAEAQGALVRLEIAKVEPSGLLEAIEGLGGDVEVISLGRRLEIVKQVGTPGNLETEFRVSAMTGTHGLGHTRLSTESRVDLSHSQPFWALGTPDLAIVHNGHITNYHRLRRMYEQDGVRFHTENDSEIIGIYLARKLAEGASLREALAASVLELDGSFSYLAATAEEFGFAKDRFCLKPLIVAESAGAIAIANEEIALQAAALAGASVAREAGAGAVGVWDVGTRRSRRSAAARTGASRKRRAA
jgi:glutamate synthase domain-containing protein 1